MAEDGAVRDALVVFFMLAMIVIGLLFFVAQLALPFIALLSGIKWLLS